MATLQAKANHEYSYGFNSKQSRLSQEGTKEAGTTRGVRGTPHYNSHQQVVGLGVGLQVHHSPLHYQSRNVYGSNALVRSPVSGPCRQPSNSFLDNNKLQQLIQFAPPSKRQLDSNFKQTLKQIKHEFKGIFKPSGLEMASKTTRSTKGMMNSSTFSHKRATLNPSIFGSGGNKAFQEAVTLNRGSSTCLEAPSERERDRYDHERANTEFKAFTIDHGLPGKIMENINNAIQGGELPTLRKKMMETSTKLGKKRVSLPEGRQTMRYKQSFSEMINKGPGIASSPFQPFSTSETLKVPQGQLPMPKNKKNQKPDDQPLPPPESRDSLRDQNFILKEKLVDLEKVQQELEEMDTIEYNRQHNIVTIQMPELLNLQSQRTVSAVDIEEPPSKAKRQKRSKSKKKVDFILEDSKPRHDRSFENGDRVQRVKERGFQSPVSLTAIARPGFLATSTQRISILPSIAGNRGKQLEIRRGDDQVIGITQVRRGYKFNNQTISLPNQNRSPKDMQLRINRASQNIDKVKKPDKLRYRKQTLEHKSVEKQQHLMGQKIGQDADVRKEKAQVEQRTKAFESAGAAIKERFGLGFGGITIKAKPERINEDLDDEGTAGHAWPYIARVVAEQEQESSPEKPKILEANPDSPIGFEKAELNGVLEGVRKVEADAAPAGEADLEPVSEIQIAVQQLDPTGEQSEGGSDSSTVQDGAEAGQLLSTKEKENENKPVARKAFKFLEEPNRAGRIRPKCDMDQINDQLVAGSIKDKHLNRGGVRTAQRYDGQLYEGNRRKGLLSPLSNESDEEPLFREQYPDFVRGITPIQHGNMSDMDPEEREEILRKMELQKHKQKIFRKKDFEMINQRQDQFQDLMEVSVTTEKQESAIIPTDVENGSLGLDNFPFATKGKGDYLAAYNRQPKKVVDKRAYDDAYNFTQRFGTKVISCDKYSDVQDSAYSDNIDPMTKQLAFLQKIQETGEKVLSDKNQAVMMQFLDYVKTEQYPENLLQIQTKLEDKVLKQGFKGYDQLPDPMMTKFSKYVYQNRAFYQVMKNITSPISLEAMHQDPHYNFIKDCDQGNVLVLSLLQKINEGSFNLIGYSLNDTYCKALRDAFMSKNFQPNVRTVHLESNGISTEGINMLLEGMERLTRLEKFVYKNNRMDSEVPMGPNGPLRTLLLKSEPIHLDELRISNCKLPSYVIEEILNTVMDENCNLSKLTLANVGMTKIAAEMVIYAIENQKNIIDLDISYNHLTSTIMYDLAECLSRNRHLQYLNLSWNNFKELRTLSSVDEPHLMDGIYEMEIAQNLCKFLKYNQNLLHVDLSNTGLTKRMLIEFGGALRKARSLICLHLSGNPGLCGDYNDEEKTQEEKDINKFLVDNEILKPSFDSPSKYEKIFQQGISTVIKHIGQLLSTQEELKEIELENREQVKMGSKREEEFVKKDSLVLLKKKIKDEEILKILDQINYNDCRDQKQRDQVRSIRKYVNVKDYLFKRVVCVPRFEPIHIESVQKDNIAKVKDGLNISNMLQNGLKQREFMENKQNHDNGFLMPVDSENKQKLIFDRFLGHKHDIGLGSGQWRQLTQTQEKCWVCEGLVYSIIFWNRSIGEACTDQIEGLSGDMMIQELEGQQNRICKLVADGKYHNKDHRLAYHTDVGMPYSCPDTPVIQGQFTNWHPCKMLPIQEYCELIDRFQPNFINILKKEGKCRKTIFNVEDLNPQETEDYDILKQKHGKNYYTKNFLKVIESNLEINEPNLVHKEFLEEYMNPPQDTAKSSNHAQSVTPESRAPSHAPTQVTSVHEHMHSPNATPFTPGNLSQHRGNQNVTPFSMQAPMKKKKSDADDAEDQVEQLFVFACYMKPGKHYFMVRLDPPAESSEDGVQTMKRSSPSDQDPDSRLKKMNREQTFESGQDIIESAGSFMSDSSNGKLQDVAYFSHATIAPYRSEDIPVHVKTYGTLSTEIVFKKNKSVFKDWKDNTDKILGACLDHDTANWKIPKMPKFKTDLEELDLVKDIIKTNIELLKIIHIYYASENAFPYASNLAIQNFVAQFKITDGMPKDFKGQVETNMKSAFTSKVPGTLEGNCLRFQFLEFIVRMAISKYMDTKRAPCPSDALKMFMRKDIRPNAKEIQEKWQGFRQNQMWSIEVNEMLEANMKHIIRLMEAFHQPRAKYLELRDAVAIFSQHSDCLSEPDARYIYGMSKMTNPNETKDLKKHKQITNVTELVEMIGRAADLSYKNTPDNDKPLAYKIGLVLDKILPLIQCKHAEPKRQQIADESQSDEDY